jgi:hypothetical protein
MSQSQQNHERGNVLLALMCLFVALMVLSWVGIHLNAAQLWVSTMPLGVTTDQHGKGFVDWHHCTETTIKNGITVDTRWRTFHCVEGNIRLDTNTQ